ncbi:MAG: hypothetical protein PHP92_05240 [Candidatus Nanoarchaeia archaeon]|nr:hypothetical protein [Candidatus Nanoarchaeia archaeon]
MDEFRKEYKIKKDDPDYEKNILASFGLEIINLLKECPIKIYSVEQAETEKEDKDTKEKYNVMSVIAKITKLQHKSKDGKCINLGKPSKVSKNNFKLSKDKVKKV